MTSERIPPLRLHEASGQGRVWINGREHYCGAFGTPECQAKYDQLIAEYLLSGRAGGPGSVSRLIDEYLEVMAPHYPVGSSGQTELTNIRCALNNIPPGVKRKSPSAVTVRDLHDIRQAMLDKGRKHKPVNRDIKRIVAMFQWGVEVGKVTPTTWHAMTALRPLRNNSPKVKAVPESDLQATLDALPDQCADICQILLWTGMRVGELLRMRWLDVDQFESPWRYTLTEHKTAATAGAKVIWIGPNAQRVLVKHLSRPVDQTVFATSKGNPYKPGMIWRMVQRACKRAGVAEWTTHQLRHNAATRIRDQHGIEAAKEVLGHSSSAMTLTYSHESVERSKRVMAESG